MLKTECGDFYLCSGGPTLSSEAVRLATLLRAFPAKKIYIFAVLLYMANPFKHKVHAPCSHRQLLIFP
jgi:hypothetical protein